MGAGSALYLLDIASGVHLQLVLFDLVLVITMTAPASGACGYDTA